MSALVRSGKLLAQSGDTACKHQSDRFAGMGDRKRASSDTACCNLVGDLYSFALVSQIFLPAASCRTGNGGQRREIGDNVRSQRPGDGNSSHICAYRSQILFHKHCCI